MSITELQKRIGVLLYKKPMTAEELAKELGVDINDVLEALKGLLIMRLVIKEGTPPVYRLAPHIREAIDQEGEEGILLHAIIEGGAVTEELAEKAADEVENRMRKDLRLKVRSVERAEVEKDEETNTYYTHLDVTLYVRSLEDALYFVFFYGPSVVEVLSDEVKIDVGDVQRALSLASAMVQGYSSLLAQKMTREELEEFNRKLWKSLRG